MSVEERGCFLAAGGAQTTQGGAGPPMWPGLWDAIGCCDPTSGSRKSGGQGSSRAEPKKTADLLRQSAAVDV